MLKKGPHFLQQTTASNISDLTQFKPWSVVFSKTLWDIFIPYTVHL